MNANSPVLGRAPVIEVDLHLELGARSEGYFLHQREVVLRESRKKERRWARPG